MYETLIGGTPEKERRVTPCGDKRAVDKHVDKAEKVSTLLYRRHLLVGETGVAPQVIPRTLHRPRKRRHARALVKGIASRKSDIEIIIAYNIRPPSRAHDSGL